MPYVRSLARRDFDARIMEILSHVKQLRAKSLKGKNGLIQCVLRNAIFQSSASFEVYLESVFEDWLYQITQNSLRFNSVPERLRYFALVKFQMPHFQQYIAKADEMKLVGALGRLADLATLMDVNSPVDRTLNRIKATSDKKYPSKRNISQLFCRFGIDSIFQKLNRLGSKDYESLLESFNDRRTEIAHVYPTPNLSIGEVRASIKNIEDIVKKMDRIIYSEVIKVSGNICWRTEGL